MTESDHKPPSYDSIRTARLICGEVYLVLPRKVFDNLVNRSALALDRACREGVREAYERAAQWHASRMEEHIAQEQFRKAQAHQDSEDHFRALAKESGNER